MSDSGISGMKNQRVWFVSSALLSVCLLLYTAFLLPQDRIFAEYKQALGRLQHPAGTEFIAEYHAFGALDRIRVMYADDFPQGCDYRVGEIREYSGARDEIEAFYRALTVRLRGENVSPGVLFIPLNERGVVDPYALPDNELIRYGPGAFDLVENLQADRTSLGLKPFSFYYYVALSGFSLSDSDPRCR